MKILHLIYDHINNPWVGGGGAVRVYELYKRLSERHHITVVCGKYPGATDYSERNLDFHFVGTHKNNYVLSTFCYAAKASQFLLSNSKSYDVIVEDFAPYNPLFSTLMTKTPHAVQVHHKEGINLFKKYFIFGLPFMTVEKFYPGLFKNSICVSEASRDKFGLPGAVIISNGINEKLFDEPGFHEEDYISYMGRLHIHNKGLDTLIKAIQMINERLVIGGAGKDKNKLFSLVRKSGLDKKVQFKGYLNDDQKRDFIGRSKFFVLPSRYEGQGIVILEAAACGKPVIISSIPELKYAVDAGFGISFKTGDADDLAGKINFLLENDTLRKALGQKAGEYAKKYLWDNIARDYERFLIKVMSGQNS
ncbi:MAG: glycosyltransferase family 4 protein [Nitrospirae bacterium]|nr:glycosyltransferase family 4 protein [Nitrospirota bacterium]